MFRDCPPASGGLVGNLAVRPVRAPERKVVGQPPLRAGVGLRVGPAARIAANGPLRLPATEAVETVWSLTSPELHPLLTRIRGWKRRRYADSLTESLATLLLPAT